MVIQNQTNEAIERHKAKLGLTGDVYLVKDHFIESLESHKRLFPNSQAKTIYEAEAERVAYEEEQERIRQILAEEARLKEEAEEQEQETENEEEQPSEE